MNDRGDLGKVIDTDRELLMWRKKKLVAENLKRFIFFQSSKASFFIQITYIDIAASSEEVQVFLCDVKSIRLF